VDAAAPVYSGSFKTCKGDIECPSGHCVDGVCCDTACKDACHSCALPGRVGTCSLVDVGTDPRGDCGGPGNCSQTCGAGGVCVPARGGNECAVSKCTGATTGAGASYCNASGASCPASTSTFDCTPYICESALGGCRGSCDSSSQCAAGYRCSTEGKCVPSAQASSSGGCYVGGGAREQGEGVPLAGVGLAVAVLARRRRRRAA